MARASVMPRPSEWRLRMMTPIMMPRYAPAPSSPAQVRAAGRLRGSDSATRPSQEGRASWVVAPDHAHPRLVDLSSQTPSGGGQRADPGQKHEPGGTDDSQVER